MDGDEDMYDEFGNPINEDSEDSDDASPEDKLYRQNLSDLSQDEQDEEDEEGNDDDNEETHDKPIGSKRNITDSGDLIVHEGKNSGMTLSQRFGTDVETIIAQPQEAGTNEPVIKPDIRRRGKVEFSVDTTIDGSSELPEIIYSREYMVNTAKQLPERIRNIALVGNLHSGKTTFLDMLVTQTHPSINKTSNTKNFKPLKFMDNHVLEIKRKMSIKSSPITLLLQDLNDKSYIFNFIDTPGHVNFKDETILALQACDGVVLTLDIVEGLTFRDKQLLDEAMKRNLPLSLLITKLDRLILELKLPLPDCYYKIQYVIDQVNEYVNNSEFIGAYTCDRYLTPQKNNVIFSSGSLQFCFNLNSFAKLYLDTFSSSKLEVELIQFSKRLWGDNFYDASCNKFVKNSNKGAFSRSFIHFILEPIYKIVTYTLTRDNNSNLLLKLLQANFGVFLTKAQLTNDSQILLKDIFKMVFPMCEGFVDLIVNSIPSPLDKSTGISARLNNTRSNSLVAQVVKLIESSDGESFKSMIRIHKGNLSIGDKIRVVGQNFNEDIDDQRIEEVQELYIPTGRYYVPVSEVNEGFIAIVKGIDSIISKGGYVFSVETDVNSLRPLSFVDYGTESVFKVAVEPKHPAELPRLLETLRKINRSYLSSVIKLEESGEHVVYGTGEVMLDCVLHDVRNFFESDLEIRVSDPMVKLSETCNEPSITKITTKSNSGAKISITSEPVANEKLSRAIELGKIDLSLLAKNTSKILRNEYNLDALESRSIWSFGPSDLKQPNILVDDTLESETDKSLLHSVKDSVILGFKWSCNEGPLCDEPIRNTKFKILDIDLNGLDSQVQTSGAQIIPMTRRACYTGFLTANPRIMEPIYKVFVTCTYRAKNAISLILDKRRGMIVSNDPIPGTPLYSVEGVVPVIESVGLETDVRLQTQGQAMCYLTFEKYEEAPGNPLDRDVYLPDLKPVPTESIARDLVLKTRRRKGLTGEPSLQKYIEPELYEKLKSIGFT